MKFWLFLVGMIIVLILLGIALIDHPIIRDHEHRLIALESASDSSAGERMIFTLIDGDTISLPREFLDHAFYEKAGNCWMIVNGEDIFTVNESPLEKAGKSK